MRDVEERTPHQHGYLPVLNFPVRMTIQTRIEYSAKLTLFIVCYLSNLTRFKAALLRIEISSGQTSKFISVGLLPT